MFVWFQYYIVYHRLNLEKWAVYTCKTAMKVEFGNSCFTDSDILASFLPVLPEYQALC